ncbi:MAG: hypothetical protein M3285_03645 [Actinomycetota bacterium]|nr:hypothetical protein [Actinomycetota bacterium]
MPDIDKDLYQLLTLVLLGLGVLLLLAMLSSLGRIRKALKQQLERLESLPAGGAQSLAASREGEAAAADLADEAREPLTEAEPAYSTASSEPIGEAPDAAGSITSTTPGGYGLGESEPSVTGASSHAETSEATSAPSDASDELAALASETPASTEGGVSDWQPDPERFGSQTQEPASGTSLGDPFGSGELSSTPVEDEPVAASGGGALQEPEDQPFERNGKWFFRRGDEFLRYDESTGQWVDADPSEAGAQASAPGAGWSAPVETGTPETGAEALPDETATAEIESVGREETAAQPAAGGFWKCASCGAVNGASATSCRMCFSQRP